MLDTLSIPQTFVVQTCCHKECLVTFAIPKEMYQKFRNTHQLFYCPRGHSQHYVRKSDLERAQEELAQVKRSKEYIEAQLATARKDRDHHKHVAAVHRGQKQALKNRIAAGLCPCCRRPFANLMRHMQNQHPHFKPETEKDTDVRPTGSTS
jgi:hypothetical protein